MNTKELVREAVQAWANQPRASELKQYPSRNPRWVAGKIGGKATPDQLPRLAATFGVTVDTLQDWIDLEATVEPELRDGMSWAAFRALVRRRDWRKVVRPGLSERDARRLAGGKVRESPKIVADKIERWWRDPDVRKELRDREDVARSLRARLDFVEDEDQRRLREYQQRAAMSRKTKTPDAAIDDLLVKTTKVTLEIETAVALIKQGAIRVVHPERHKEIYEMFDRLGNAGFDGMDVIKDNPPDDAIDVDPQGPPPELGP